MSQYHRRASSMIAKFATWYKREMQDAARRILRAHPDGLSGVDLATALGESPHGLAGLLLGANDIRKLRRLSQIQNHGPDVTWYVLIGIKAVVDPGQETLDLAVSKPGIPSNQGPVAGRSERRNLRE